MIEHIGIILNSISIVCISCAISRVRSRSISNDNRLQSLRIRQDEEQEKRRALESVVKEITKDVKNMRLEITEAAPRKELSLSEFANPWGRWIRFEDGNEFPEDLLDFTAQIALKAIASEIPKEKRTHEIIIKIINRMPDKLGQSKIVL